MEIKNTQMEEQDIFITELYVKECRGIKDFKISLSKEERKHLIITGKNGSGKTSLLEDLNDVILKVYESTFTDINNEMKVIFGDDIIRGAKSELYKDLTNERERLTREIIKSKVTFFLDKGNSFWEGVQTGSFLTVYFPAHRKLKVNSSNGGEFVGLPSKVSSIERLKAVFLQYIVNLKIEQLFAKVEGDILNVTKIDDWFNRFLNGLRTVLGNPDLELRFDRKKYTFWLIEKEKEPYEFNSLSDGYSAVLNIIIELIMRMEAKERDVYNMHGVVLIDEIETHLHVDLQKKILPFLTTFFPKIQFIVTTHSPFVISSMKDAVVCDLEHQIVANDLSTYSYDALLESYFGVDKYSSVLKEKVTEYEVLSSKKELEVAEEFRLKDLRAYLDQAPLFLSKELKVKLQEIDLNNLNKA